MAEFWNPTGLQHGQDRPATQLEQNGGEPAAGIRGMHQSDGAVRVPCNGTKRARVGKASGSTDRSLGRTLSAICP